VAAEQNWLGYVSQWFAEQGFAVLAVDGRGTPGRGPACRGTLLAGLCRARWMDGCARPYQEDLVRIGPIAKEQLGHSAVGLIADGKACLLKRAS
jgi:dipeptidyl-peptidase-4